MHLLYSRFFTKAMADCGLDRRARAVPAALQPGPGPGRRRRADEQVARQRGGSRRARRPVRRRHRPPLPDVHGPLGPGRPVEPERHRRRGPLPQPGLDDRPGPAGDRAGRRRRRDAAGRRGRRGRREGDPRRGPPDAGRGHGRLRGLPLQHDGREADGAGEPALPLPRDGGRRAARPGTRRSGCCCSCSPPRRPTSPRSSGRGGSRRPGRRGRPSTPSAGRRWTRRPRRSRRASCRSRSTARSATGSRWPSGSPRRRSRRSSWPARR